MNIEDIGKRLQGLISEMLDLYADIMHGSSPVLSELKKTSWGRLCIFPGQIVKEGIYNKILQ